MRYAPPTAADRITQLSIGGMRCIDEIKLDLGAFTVLIGENGAGKSTIVHCRLDAQRSTELARLDRSVIQEWLDDFRGIGELRREGLEDLAFPPAS